MKAATTKEPTPRGEIRGVGTTVSQPSDAALLQRVQRIIESKVAWHPLHPASTVAGGQCFVDSKDAARFSLQGAIIRAALELHPSGQTRLDAPGGGSERRPVLLPPYLRGYKLASRVAYVAGFGASDALHRWHASATHSQVKRLVKLCLAAIEKEDNQS